MALIVQKYGGTSVGDPDRIKNVARKVVARKRKGDSVVVVVSAMSGETNKLVALVNKIAEIHDTREYDQVVSTGEQITIGLVTLAIQALGEKSRSFLGLQVPILTNSTSAKARILQVGEKNLRKALAEGIIPVVAGFQGVDEKGNVTTLGRGGSDTTAVAVAAALKADLCEIYTDVDGVYTADPNICEKARRLDRVSYDEMLELASMGAKVLQTRSVELAKRFRVPVLTLSSFTEGGGTLMKEGKGMESLVVSGVAADRNEAKVTVSHVPDRQGIAARLFQAVADANVVVDMIVQNVSESGYTDITFTVTKADLARAQKTVAGIIGELGAGKVRTDVKVAKVSIIGSGMHSQPGVAARMFSTLAKEGINILMISTSEIKVSCLIEEKYAELAVRALHAAFLEEEKQPKKAGKKPKG
jgi:aspartate kinase